MNKKIMSFVLAVSVLFTMIFAMNITANAKIDSVKLGGNFELTMSGKFSSAEESGNIKDIKFDTERSTASGEIVKIEQKDDQIVVTCKATTVGEFVISYQRFQFSIQTFDDTWVACSNGKLITSEIAVGEMQSFVLKGRKLSNDEVYKNIRNINAVDGLKVVATEQLAEGVKVTVQGVSVTESTAVTFEEYRLVGSDDEWYPGAVIFEVTAAKDVNNCGKQLPGHAMTLVEGVAATAQKAGYKSYYKCECGKCYEDANATVEITDIEAWKTSGNGYIAKLGTTSPQTGDNSIVLSALILISTGVLMGAVLYGKKRFE